MTKKADYDASSIEVLEGLEAVRRRPGMYVGGTGKEGYHHLLWEILDNAVDEAMNGHCTEVAVRVGDYDASVEDNGRGIPFDTHKDGRSAVEVIFTTLHAGGKFGGGGYAVAGGLHGVGSSVVCALSSVLEVTVFRDGISYQQAFHRGAPSKAKHGTGPAKKRGTHVYFVPDEKVFGPQSFDLALVRERVRTKAYLTPGVTFTLNGETFLYRGGLADLVAARVAEEGLTAVTEFPFVAQSVSLQVALTWTTDPRTADDLVVSFANGIPLSLIHI